MNGTTEPQEGAAEGAMDGDVHGGDATTFRLPEHLRHLLASAIEYVHARLELAGLEGKEAFVVCAKVAAAVVAAVALLAFGYIFLLMALVAVLVYFFGLFWGWVVLAVALAHFIGVGVCLLMAKLWWQRPCFPATLEELRKDQEWLSRSKKTARQL